MLNSKVSQNFNFPQFTYRSVWAYAASGFECVWIWLRRLDTGRACQGHWCQAWLRDWYRGGMDTEYLLTWNTKRGNIKVIFIYGQLHYSMKVKYISNTGKTSTMTWQWSNFQSNMLVSLHIKNKKGPRIMSFKKLCLEHLFTELLAMIVICVRLQDVQRFPVRRLALDVSFHIKCITHVAWGYDMQPAFFIL